MDVGDFPMGFDEDEEKDKKDDKKDDKKRELDKNVNQKEPALKKQSSLTLSVSLSPPNPSPTKVDTFSGITDEGATFAVWNLWDLGGGPHSSHWKEGNLTKLPGELKAINASVLGLLEIKTGHAIAVQLPQEKIETTAFEIGALTGWLMKWYTDFRLYKNTTLPPKKLSEIFVELSQMMWVSDDPTYLNKGLSSAVEYDPPVYLSDLEAVVKDMILDAADYFAEMTVEQTKKLFIWMADRCGRFENSWYKYSPIELDDLEKPSEIKAFWLKKKTQLLSTWKFVPKAFENFGGMVGSGEEEKKGKEAQGINLITPVLKKFVEENKTYKPVIINPVKGDGETTAFLYDESKFDICCSNSINLSGMNWRARSPGYVHLKCKPGTLKEDDLMVVAWHAPSENNVGERQHAYELLNSYLKAPGTIKSCLTDANVVLLADMNLRFQPARCEAKILEVVYSGWLPESETHMGLCTSLKMSGSNGAQWNHPFDKVILLNRNKLKLKITDHEKMKDTRSAEEIRVFSDHSWVKAKISLDKK